MKVNHVFSIDIDIYQNKLRYGYMPSMLSRHFPHCLMVILGQVLFLVIRLIKISLMVSNLYSIGRPSLIVLLQDIFVFLKIGKGEFIC
jgi:hypothetical protein